MEFDSLLSSLGEFGAYQRYQYFLLCLVGIPSAFYNLGYVFWAARPDHWCGPPYDASPAVKNLTTQQWKQLAIPLVQQDDGSIAYSQCEFYTKDYHDMNNSSLESLHSIWSNSSFLTEPCQTWQFDRSQYETTIITDFNLVCDRKWLASTTQSIFMGGRIAGTVLFGHLADKYGRRLSLLLSTSLQIILSILSSFMPEVWSFSLIRFFLAVVSTGQFQTAFIMSMEIVGPKWRVFTGTVFQMFWATGYMLMAVLAYFIRDRLTLMVATSTPFVLMISYYWLIPESPRWLLVTGRDDEAHKIIHKMARINKKEIPENLQVKVPEESQTQSFTELLRWPFIRRMAAFLFFIWFTNAVVYYGLSLNSSSLAGDDYVNFAIAGAVEIPAYMLALLTLSWCGRRCPLFIVMMLGGISLIATIPVPKEMINTSLALAMLGKFSITCSFSMIYVHTAELFPTSVRSLGLGLCSFMARIGGVIAPYAADVGEVYEDLPLSIFGVMSFIAALFVLALPETKGQRLPETLSDGEALAANRKIFTCCCQRSERAEATTENIDL